MTNTTSNETNMVCPLCGESFSDIHKFAAHLNEHSANEKKRKAEEEKKERENQRKKDIDNLLALKAEYKAAEKKLETALDEYEKKYGGLLFPYTSDTNVIKGINELLHIFGL